MHIKLSAHAEKRRRTRHIHLKQIYHRDHNTRNNCASNLQIMTPEEHYKFHGKQTGKSK